MDYLPIVIDSFLIDRRAQGLSMETVKFYKKKLRYFAKFCESHAVTQIEQITPDLLRRYLLELGEGHNPGESFSQSVLGQNLT
jgi:site-specific recombinase XerD